MEALKPPWTMTESGFIRCPREHFAESPIFMEVATEHNGILFADLCKRSWE